MYHFVWQAVKFDVSMHPEKPTHVRAHVSLMESRDREEEGIPGYDSTLGI
jgi:hypothetical protein